MSLTNEPRRVIVCAGTGCVSSGSLSVRDNFSDRAEGVDIRISGCHGFCEKGPLVRIEPEGTLYTGVDTDDVPEILAAVESDSIAESLCYHSVDGEVYTREESIPFYEGQRRLVLSNCGRIDPTEIEAYRGEGGYESLEFAVTEMTPAAVREEVSEAGLRGRGGAGFPTGRKWELARDHEAPRYVIANCDEGDPGAFMDRSLVEGDPHRVLEGMAIAGYAIDAAQGYFFIRAEYPLAVERIRDAIEAAREADLLGSDILGTGFDFDIEVKQGAGAFVSGEETALIKSIEGKRGMPEPRPPYPTTAGLWGQPTVINNVETLGNVPTIIEKGGDWYADIGDEDSPGTKTFAVTGDVRNTGLIEVPLGITLREVVFDIAGGIDSDGEFKAVQIGGPSGGCLCEEHLDLPLTFDSLAEVGAMIGSGGLVVMDDSNCMVEVAQYFLSFTQEESCGKCPPCRLGTNRMLSILEDLTEGVAEPEDMDRLEELAEYVADASLCGLGQTAPNPVRSTLQYFPDEYEAHVEGRCPTGECFAGEADVPAASAGGR